MDVGEAQQRNSCSPGPALHRILQQCLWPCFGASSAPGELQLPHREALGGLWVPGNQEKEGETLRSEAPAKESELSPGAEEFSL